MSCLDVLICTHGREGLERIVAMNLIEMDYVRYVVSCQSEVVSLPVSLVRDDIKVVFTSTKGLSNNRNNALTHANADYALLCDDDLTLYPDRLIDIISTFDRNPDIDIATFMVNFPEGKVYPSDEHDIWQPYKDYDICSVEIALRMKSVKENNLSFNPLWGIGAPRLGCGEESVFLLMAKKAGLNGRFFPLCIGAHPSGSTGDRPEPAVLCAQGAYICLEYPITALPRLLLKAFRMPSGFLHNLWYLTCGGFYGVLNRRSLLS